MTIWGGSAFMRCDRTFQAVQDRDTLFFDQRNTEDLWRVMEPTTAVHTPVRLYQRGSLPRADLVTWYVDTVLMPRCCASFAHLQLDVSNVFPQQQDNLLKHTGYVGPIVVIFVHSFASGHGGPNLKLLGLTTQIQAVGVPPDHRHDGW